MYHIIIEAEQENSVSIKAYISCWIHFNLQDGAELLANHYVKKAGWVPIKIQNIDLIEPTNISLEHLQYYQDTIREGACLVFHVWHE